MTEDNVLDLRQQIVDLFTKEEMLAFFDFVMDVGSSERVTGLCKISRPKTGKARSLYYSMLFIIDTADEKARGDVEKHLKSVDWEGLGAGIPGIEGVLSMRGLDLGPTVYFQEADMYVKKGTDVSARYMAQEVYPAVVRAVGLKAGELMFWDDLAEKDTALGSKVAAAVSSGRSPLKRLRDLLRK